MNLTPVCLLDVVGLTPRLVGEATPCLRALASEHGARPLTGVLPAVTCSAQASALTGSLPSSHGIVGNGWLFRDTQEVRFWQQSRRLIQAETLYDVARERAAAAGAPFRCAKLFWWFNQGAGVDFSLTPKPWYGSDGNKAFGIHGSPPGFAKDTVDALGPFPFHAFWGPFAGLPSSQWIAQAAARVLRQHRPTLTLVYLPHLDYDLQRHGASAASTTARLQEIDACAGTVIDAARQIGAEVVVLSEYGLTDVARPVAPNRVLRSHELLTVRDGPFGEQPDLFQSRAFAVADHQIAHVYVADPADRDTVARLLEAEDGVERVLRADDKQREGLDHARAGELVALAAPDAWFTYPYWLEPAKAPDFARTVDIHRKPGYDPCELFLDPGLCCPRLRAGVRLLQKKLGFRTRFDVIPLDAHLVKGSHGLRPTDAQDGPVLLTTAHPPSDTPAIPDIRDYVLGLLGLG